MDYWKEKLNPFDMELCMMVESLTGMPCEPKNGGDGYFIMANYSKHNEPDYINAVWNAIEGRAGKRLLEINDMPDQQCIYVRIAFSDSKYPSLFTKVENTKSDPNFGNLYCRQLQEIRALQVTRNNVDALMAFVGNGELEIPKTINATAVFHFLNAGGSVYNHAPEHSYIVYVKDGLFEVVPKEKFESEYERK